MGCAFVQGYKSKKSKRFELSAIEEACNARGMTLAKLYRKIPSLLESVRHREPIGIATQFEISILLDFPLPFFYHINIPDQKRQIMMCGSGIVPCAFCSKVSDFYCDAPIGKGRTCDLPLCIDHKYHRPDIGVDIDYCPHHKHMGKEIKQ
jgi:hypothetical protein